MGRSPVVAFGLALAPMLVAGLLSGCGTPSTRVIPDASPDRGSVVPSSTPAPQEAAPQEDAVREAAVREAAADGRPSGVPGRAQQALVAAHTDGDTLRLVAPRSGRALAAGVETKVRLLEIDSPEASNFGAAEQCFAEESSERLRALAPTGSTVWALPDRELRDRYDRTLLYLWNDRGVFVNLAMVRGGFARAVLFEPNDLHIEKMRAAEDRARTAGRGLWSACSFFGQPLVPG